MHIITYKDTGAVISEKAEIASTFFSRAIGLMFKRDMDPQGALIFYHATSIHTFFMRFAFDLVFLDKEQKIIRICEHIGPWKLAWCP